DFEFFCIYRWLVLSCFCERNGIQGLFHADSDVLIYSSMADIAKALDDCEAAISWGRSAHASFWTAKALSEFSDFIVSTYRRKDGLRFRELAAFHNAFVRERRPGGVSDMTLINLFFRDRRCVDLTQTISGGTFDHNINMSDNRNIEFEMFRGIKRLTWRNSIPYGRPLNGAADVRFHALHCQGWAKQWISRVCAERPPASRIEVIGQRIVRFAIRRIVRVVGKLLRLAYLIRGDPSG